MIKESPPRITTVKGHTEITKYSTIYTLPFSLCNSEGQSILNTFFKTTLEYYYWQVIITVSHVALFSICRHLCLSASDWLCCWGSWSIIVSHFVFDSFHLSDGRLRQTGVFPSASLADCRRAHKAVQPASWETAVPELSVGLEAHRSVCLTLSFSFFRSICSAPIPACSCSFLLCLHRDTQWCVLSA